MNTETQEQDQLAVVIASSPLEKTKAQRLKEMFVPYFDKMHEVEKKIASIDKNEPTPTDIKIAREIRLALKNNRIAAEKVKTQQKESVLIEGRVIDNLYGVINNTSKSLESELEQIERSAEIKEAARKKQLAEERALSLQPYEVDLTGYDLGAMAENTFEQLLENSRIGFEKRQEDKRKEEEARIKKEADERLHKEREQELRPLLKYADTNALVDNYAVYSKEEWQDIISTTIQTKARVELHNYRTKELTPYWNFIPAETPTDLSQLDMLDYEELLLSVQGKYKEHEAEQQRIKEENERLKAESERAATAAREKQELQNKRFNALRPYTNFCEDVDMLNLSNLTEDAFDALLFDKQALYNKDKQEKEAEQLRKDKEAAELKAKQEQIEREEKQRVAAAKKAALAPDKEKLLALATTIDNMPLPDLSTPEAAAIKSSIKELLTKTTTYLRQKANEL